MKATLFRSNRTGVLSLFAASLVAGAALLSGCASSRGSDVDPIFSAVPGGRYGCESAPDNRNVVVKGATSTVGQAVVGGAAGGLLGNQFGGGTGRDLATGAGIAAGAAAGAWNANRMANNRKNDCRQTQAQPQTAPRKAVPQQGSSPYHYRYQGS